MPVNTLFERSSQFLLNLLFPPRCVHCQAIAGWLCEECLSQIPLLAPPVCDRCGAPGPNQPCRECRKNPMQYLQGIRSAAYFKDNPLQPAIHAFKYRGQRVLAPLFGHMLAEAYHRFQLEGEVLVPVPLHLSRFRERGSNQSELLAVQLGQRLNLPVNTDSLQRIQNTEHQMKLPWKERRQNVAHAFRCQDERLAGQTVVLVDDVCTTGSTLDACAGALQERGAAAVWGLTLAKAHNV